MMAANGHSRLTETQESGLRVMMVAPTSFFNDYGGHIRILEEALVLRELGHQISIITYFQGHDVADLDIRRTRRLPYRADYEVGSSRHKLAFDIFLLTKSIKEGLSIKPHLIHGHMHEGALIGSFLARLLGIPLLLDFQGSLSAEMVDHGFLNQGGMFYPWVHRLERYIVHRPDAILTSSLRAVDLLSDEFSVPKERIHPLPDCVDTARFNPEKYSKSDRLALRTVLGVPNAMPIVAYLGLLADYQGTPELIQAAARLIGQGADVHFLIMGYPKVDHFRSMAESMGLEGHITFTGKVPYDLAPLYLSLGDLAVSTKMSTSEGSGKVLNYMAMAQPVVAFDTPVHREYLHELGVYAPVQNVSLLAEAILSVIEDRQKAVDVGLELRKRAEELFSWQAAGDKISQLYSSLV